MKKFWIGLSMALSVSFAQAQNVGIGTATPSPSAKLEINAADQGVLLPRVALTGSTDATTITNGNVTSLLVYNTASVSDITPGFYYWTGTVWQRLAVQADADWYEAATTQAPAAISDAIYTDNNVGIETTTPRVNLEIGSAAAGAYRNWMERGVLFGENSDGMYVGLKNEGADRQDAIISWGDNRGLDHLRFLFHASGFTTSEEHMRIQSDGVIGMGTTTPDNGARLDISDTRRGLLIPRIALSSTTDATTIIGGNVTSLLLYNTATTADVTPGFYYWTGTVGNVWACKQTTIGTAGNTTDQATDIGQEVYTNSNVGIGIDDPSTKLQIGDNPGGVYRPWMNFGTLYGIRSDGMYVGLKEEGTDRQDAVIAWGDNLGNENMRFLFNRTGSTTSEEHMRIDSRGNVGIGTTTSGYKLEVDGGVLLRNAGDSYFWSERSDSEFDIIQDAGNTKRAFSIHPAQTGTNPSLFTTIMAVHSHLP